MAEPSKISPSVLAQVRKSTGSAAAAKACPSLGAAIGLLSPSPWRRRESQCPIILRAIDEEMPIGQVQELLEHKKNRKTVLQDGKMSTSKNGFLLLYRLSFNIPLPYKNQVYRCKIARRCFEERVPEKKSSLLLIFSLVLICCICRRSVI